MKNFLFLCSEPSHPYERLGKHSFSMVCDNNRISLLLYDNDKFDDTKNRKVLMSTIKSIKNLKSNFSDNLPACYAYAVIITCRLAENFVLPFQKVSFTCYFTLEIFSLVIILQIWQGMVLYFSTFYISFLCR